MRIGILGSGNVGSTIGAKLKALGHEIKLSSRVAGEGKVTFADAAAFGELLFNTTSGSGSLDALKAAGEAHLGHKVLIDVANPLDFSKGFPPSLTVANTDSLAETLQRAFPKLRVVKALNTVNASVMVNPQALANGEQVLHRYAAKDRGVGFEPVAQHDFRAGNHRRGIPQGVVEVEGDQLDAHESVPLLRLARGWALSYTAARCWKSRWV